MVRPRLCWDGGRPYFQKVSHRAPQARGRVREEREDPVARRVQIADIAPNEALSVTAGDIPRGRVRVLPAGDLRRRRGQESCPPTRRTSPAGG